MQSVLEIHTGRLTMRPVAPGDLADLQALKADPRSFAKLLGGVRTYRQSAAELAEDMSFWAQHGYGMWTLRLSKTDVFVGIAGLMERTDGRGIALRFALRPEAQGFGYGSEAAGAVLRFAHDHVGLRRVIAVAQEDNIGSRQALGAIGMRQSDRFFQHGVWKLEYESIRDPRKDETDQAVPRP
jgi:RimJ/RimL family protein N-acetyltransferase